MKRAFISMTLAAYALFLAACGTTVNTIINTITGSGNIVTDTRVVSGFTSIEIELGADLALTQGDSEGLIVIADDNLLPYIETDVRNGRLIISAPDNTNVTGSRPIELRLSFVDLSTISIFGSSHITGQGLNLDTLAIDFAGSGSTLLTGTIDRQAITVRGQATIANLGVVSQDVSVDIAGNGTVEVDAANTLSISVAGIGNIRYRGNPTITRNIAGAATINPQQ